MPGRSGKKTAPTAQHSHPDIIPKLAEHRVLGMLGPPKFGIQDPTELTNGRIQDKVRTRASLPLASVTDAPGLSCKTRRYASGRPFFPSLHFSPEPYKRWFRERCHATTPKVRNDHTRPFARPRANSTVRPARKQARRQCRPTNHIKVQYSSKSSEHSLPVLTLTKAR